MASRVVTRITYLTANRNTPLPQGVAAGCHNFDRSIATRTHLNTDSARTSHCALTHLAAAGRTSPELQAQSRHQHLASLGRYVRLGEETSARITAEHDPAARRRTR